MMLLVKVVKGLVLDEKHKRTRKPTGRKLFLRRRIASLEFQDKRITYVKGIFRLARRPIAPMYNSLSPAEQNWLQRKAESAPWIPLGILSALETARILTSIAGPMTRQVLTCLIRGEDSTLFRIGEIPKPERLQKAPKPKLETTVRSGNCNCGNGWCSVHGTEHYSKKRENKLRKENVVFHFPYPA